VFYHYFNKQIHGILPTSTLLDPFGHSVKRNTTHMWIQFGYPWIHWSTDLTPEETYSRVCTKLLDGKPCPSRDSQWTKHGAVDVAGCHGMSGDLLLMIVFNYVFIHISIC
jgi:hypothetical protein